MHGESGEVARVALADASASMRPHAYAWGKARVHNWLMD